MPFSSDLEVQAALAGSIGQCLDAAVVAVAAAVEHHLVDAGLLGALGQKLAHRGGGRLVGAGLERASKTLLEARCGSHGPAPGVVDHLRIDVLGGAEYGQPGPPAAGAGERTAHPLLAAIELVQLAEHDLRLTSSCLPCAGCTRPGSGYPCPGRAPACARPGSRRPSGRPSACRCPIL